MKKMSVLAAALALGMGMVSVVQAQPRDDRRGPPPPPPSHGPAKHLGNPHVPPPGHMKHDNRGHGPDRRDFDHHRGAGPDHRWVKGYRVPPQYRGPQYVVQDWRSHRLSAPPRGYHWVQYGGDYMLVAIASGVIAQLILGGH